MEGFYECLGPLIHALAVKSYTLAIRGIGGGWNASKVNFSLSN